MHGMKVQILIRTGYEGNGLVISFKLGFCKRIRKNIGKSTVSAKSLEGNSIEPNCDTMGIMHPRLGEVPSSPNVIGARMGEGGTLRML